MVQNDTVWTLERTVPWQGEVFTIQKKTDSLEGTSVLLKDTRKPIPNTTTMTSVIPTDPSTAMTRQRRREGGLTDTVLFGLSNQFEIPYSGTWGSLTRLGLSLWCHKEGGEGYSGSSKKNSGIKNRSETVLTLHKSGDILTPPVFLGFLKDKPWFFLCPFRRRDLLLSSRW